MEDGELRAQEGRRVENELNEPRLRNPTMSIGAPVDD